MSIKPSRIKNLFIFLFIFFLYSCKNLPNNYKGDSKDYKEIESIDINNLMVRLLESDKNLTPELNYSKDGGSYYSYTKKPGEGDLSLKEIKKRVSLGSKFYEKDRENIKILLGKINELRINNKLSYVESGALGLWIPNKEQIVIDYKVISMGSPTFLDVLSHEIIHVAQSCSTSSRKNFPKRIGLPLEFSKEINLNLSHNVYSRNSKEVMYIEREAFTYSKVDGAAIKLLNKFCK